MLGSSAELQLMPWVDCTPISLYIFVCEHPRVQRGSSPILGLVFSFLTKRRVQDTRTYCRQTLSRAPGRGSCRAILVSSGPGSACFLGSSSGPRSCSRAPRVHLLPCSRRRFRIDLTRSIDMNFVSDGLSCDCSSAPHQKDCESSRRAARGDRIGRFVFSCWLLFFIFRFSCLVN